MKPGYDPQTKTPACPETEGRATIRFGVRERSSSACGSSMGSRVRRRLGTFVKPSEVRVDLSETYWNGL